MRAKDVMTTKIVSVSPDHNVRHAAKLMLDNSISGLPVIDDEGLIVGLISEGDLIRRTELVSVVLDTPDETAMSADERASDYIKRNSWRVGDAMTADPVCVGEDVSLAHIAKLMDERHIKRIPITSSGKVIGIVSRADLLQAILAASPDTTAAGDEAIRLSILRRFEENTGLEGLDLRVSVIDGMVHLGGCVPATERRKAARIVAEGVRGVRGVVEHFTAPTS